MKVAVTGHRSDKLAFLNMSGYDPLNPLRVALRHEMRVRLVTLKPEVAYSGMAIGVDQDFCVVCLNLSIPYIAGVPFEGQEKTWPKQAQKVYFELLERASKVHYVCEPGYAAWKMQRRNEWQVDEIGEDGVLLACFDGSPGGTKNCIDYAKSVGREISFINPVEIGNKIWGRND